MHCIDQPDVAGGGGIEPLAEQQELTGL